MTGQSVRSDNTSLMLGEGQIGGTLPPRNEFLGQVHPEDWPAL